MAPYKILKQGYMMKEPPLSKRGIRKRVLRYWFVLVEDKNQVALVYFKTEDAYLTRQRNEGFIRVDEAENISVIGEHMGHKNVFVVKTPKGDFHLLPESRYDLHEWLFTLHNALENFKKRVERRQQQQQQPPQQQAEQQAQRPRANTAEKQHKPSATAGHTPPYRRAPPPPTDIARRESGSGESAPPTEPSASAVNKNSIRRKPVRPAPVAPGGRRISSTSSQRLSQEVLVSPQNEQLPQETPPPQYSASLPSPSEGLRMQYGMEGGGVGWMSQEGYDQDAFSTMESGQHVVVLDLNITQTEREYTSPGASDDPTSPPPPVHVRSASDPIVLMQSNSLPDLINPDSSTSPDNPDETMGEHGWVAQAQCSPNINHGHTRHLSLMGVRVNLNGKGRKQGHNLRKKKPKRASSVKQRSRSPPNLPPPPPPPGFIVGELEFSPPEPEQVDGEGERGQAEGSPSSTGITHNLASTASLGYSEVLTTITNIDQQLNQMNQEFDTSTFKPALHPPEASPVGPSSKPAPSSPNVANILFYHPKLGLSPAPDVGPSPVPEEEVGFDFQEDEWLLDLPSERQPPPVASVESTDHDVGPSPHFIATDHSPKPELTNGEPVLLSGKPGKGKHRVMFKEEVEDIPTYEPRVDMTTPPLQDEVPTGVAAIKMKLFGNQEQEATRYKKEGVLSPKHVHPVNITFGEHYFNGTTGSRETSPNVNNNNSEEDSVVSDSLVTSAGGRGAEAGMETRAEKGVVVVEDPPEPNQNLYDSPWEQKAVSKYNVIGIKHRAGSPGAVKEKTPPPTAPKRAKIQIAKVSVKETPQPIATEVEVRNVHSLERKRSNDRPPRTRGRGSVSPPAAPGMVGIGGGGTVEDSLLASISNALQVTSRYGSDSFLSRGDSPSGTGGGANAGKRLSGSGELKFSTRGELEKIRAAHRKDTTPITTPLVQNNTKPIIQHSSPQIYSPKSPISNNPSSPARGLAVGGAMKSSHMTSSLEGLQRRADTHVTYDAQTQAHIFRSLV